MVRISNSLLSHRPLLSLTPKQWWWSEQHITTEELLRKSSSFGSDDTWPTLYIEDSTKLMLLWFRLCSNMRLCVKLNQLELRWKKSTDRQCQALSDAESIEVELGIMLSGLFTLELLHSRDELSLYSIAFGGEC